MADKKWISELFDRDEDARRSTELRQKHELERRRKWEAKAPDCFADLKKEMNKILDQFDAELAARNPGTRKKVHRNDASIYTAAYTYEGASVIVTLDKQGERVRSEYSGSSSKTLIMTEVSDSDELTVHAAGYRTNVRDLEEAAETILMPFIEQAVKLAR